MSTSCTVLLVDANIAPELRGEQPIRRAWVMSHVNATSLLNNTRPPIVVLRPYRGKRPSGQLHRCASRAQGGAASYNPCTPIVPALPDAIATFILSVEYHPLARI